MANIKQSLINSRIEADREAVSSHYDLSPELFASFLGPRMAYSCAYFLDENESLARAEENKLKLTAEKLELKEGEKLLDIGSGWGSMLFYCAEKYGCKTNGISLAAEQVKYVNDKAKDLGFDKNVNSRVMHAYDLNFRDKYFDKIVTIGAIEHMEDLEKVFGNAHRVLKDDGLFLVHGMTKPWQSRKDEIDGKESEAGKLVKKYFGVGYWHSLFEVIESLEKKGFEILDIENITRHYQYTAERWLENLQQKEKEISGKLIPEDKYREFIAFTAAFVVGFELSTTLCQQILCQKISTGELRQKRPFLRKVLESNE